MKKLLLAIVGLMAITATYSQTTAKLIRTERKYEVNEMAIRNFKVDFPTAINPTYTRTKSFDEVRFTDNGVQSTAFYDWNSKLVGTTTRKQFSDLPASARKDILKQWKGYQVGEIILFNDNEENDADMELYGTAFDDADNYFVSLKKANKVIVVKVTTAGMVNFFSER